jgi:hypothetical protein
MASTMLESVVRGSAMDEMIKKSDLENLQKNLQKNLQEEIRASEARLGGEDR